jgi:hypothetical protein
MTAADPHLARVAHGQNAREVTREPQPKAGPN